MKVFYTLLLLLLPFLIVAQCIPSRHNTNANDGWVSCTTSNNPNAIRGSGHWIRYDLGAMHHIEDLHFWNYNHPDFLDRGARDITIDISSNGTNWTEVATYTLEQATGKSTYIGELGPLINQSARHVLITINNTYGASCAALGEIRIGVSDEINCQPNVSLTGDLGRRKYDVQDYIETNGNTSVTDLVQLKAVNEVNLNQGFTTLLNAQLEILLGPCD